MFFSCWVNTPYGGERRWGQFGWQGMGSRRVLPAPAPLTSLLYVILIRCVRWVLNVDVRISHTATLNAIYWLKINGVLTYHKMYNHYQLTAPLLKKSKLSSNLNESQGYKFLWIITEIVYFPMCSQVYY